MDSKQYIVVVEISSSRISAIAATMDSVSKDVTEVCHVEEPVNGSVRYGSIINVDEVYTKVGQVLDKIEKHGKISPRKIDRVFVGIDARSLCSENVKVERAISEDFPITEALVKSVEEEARKGFEHLDVLMVEPVCYEVDGKEVVNPVGAIGNHLSAIYTIVACKTQIRRFISMVIERLGVKLAGVVVTPVAVSELVLTDSERRLGAMLVDMGADTTSVAIYKANKLVYVSVMPMGSRNITRDLTTLNILEEDAERIKRTFGLSAETDIPKGDIMPGVDSIVALNYIKSRAGEIVANIANQLKEAGIEPEDLPSGVVLVGRGSKLKGFKEELHNALGMDVRRGSIPGVGGKDEYNDRVGALALLDKASSMMMEGETCMLLPEMPKPEEEHEEETVEEKKPNKRKAEKTSSPRSSWWNRLTGKLGAGIDTVLGGEDDEDEKK